MNTLNEPNLLGLLFILSGVIMLILSLTFSSGLESTEESFSMFFCGTMLSIVGIYLIIRDDMDFKDD